MSKKLPNHCYNEHKVRLGGAELLHSANYPKDTEQLSFTDRFNRLKKQTELSTTIKVNTVHISLNFSDADKGMLGSELLKEIADRYMEKIGFGGQPYLVYKHNDAGHEHLHIVTTNVKSDGQGISLHNLAKGRSLKAAKQIENEFGLTVAANNQRQAYQLTPINALKIQYGRFGIKRAITNVLDHVLPTYKYASIAELNAVLKLYNVMADTGGKGTRIERNGGLVYRVLDDKGQAVGVPVKASLIYNKPTLKSLQGKFAQNKTLKQKHKVHVKNEVEYILLRKKGPITIDALIDALKLKGIQVVVRQNKAGFIYGMTYVDHTTKCVYNGSDLGKTYAASGLLQRLNPIGAVKQSHKTSQQQTLVQSPGQISPQNKPILAPLQTPFCMPGKEALQNLIFVLTREEYAGTLSYELRSDIKKRRKRKRPKPES